MTYAYTYTAPVLRSAPVANPMQQAPPPPQKLVLGKCPVRSTNILGVRRPSGVYYFYNFNPQKGRLVPHCCTCQVKTTESCLQPLYPEFSDKLDEVVIFCFNTLSNKVEQYVYDFETSGLKEVEKTGLVYNSASITQTSLVAVIEDDGTGPDDSVIIERDAYGTVRKQGIKNNRTTLKPIVEVKTLMMAKIEAQACLERSDSEYSDDSEDSDYSEDSGSDSDESDTESTEYADYICTLSPITICFCSHYNRETVNVFNYRNDSYDTFYYDDRTGDFKQSECTACPKRTTEQNLIPKYTEQALDGTHVFHCYNTLTGLMEKYKFNGTGFEQVSYPELVYECSKNTITVVLYTFTTMNIPQYTTVIMRNAQGQFRKEAFCPVQNKYVLMDPVPVKTFIVQRKEVEKKKKEEKKAKRKAEKKEKKAVINTSAPAPETPTQMTITKEKVPTLATSTPFEARAPVNLVTPGATQSANTNPAPQAQFEPSSYFSRENMPGLQSSNLLEQYFESMKLSSGIPWFGQTERASPRAGTAQSWISESDYPHDGVSFQRK